MIAMDAESLAGALAVDQDDEIMMLTKKGQAIRCPVLNVRSTSRGTKGVKLVDLAKGDRLVAVSRVIQMKEGDEDAEEDEDHANATDAMAENSAVETTSPNEVDPDEGNDEEDVSET